MRTHISILAWLMIVLHGVFVLLALFMLLAGSTVAAMLGLSGGGHFGGAGFAAALFTFFALVFLIVGLPGTAVGIGLLRYAQWARIGAIIMSILNIVNVGTFGVSTLIGVYGLWVMFNPETQALFEQRTVSD